MVKVIAYRSSGTPLARMPLPSFLSTLPAATPTSTSVSAPSSIDADASGVAESSRALAFALMPVVALLSLVWAVSSTAIFRESSPTSLPGVGCVFGRPVGTRKAGEREGSEKTTNRRVLIPISCSCHGHHAHALVVGGAMATTLLPFSTPLCFPEKQAACSAIHMHPLAIRRNLYHACDRMIHRVRSRYLHPPSPARN